MRLKVDSLQLRVKPGPIPRGRKTHAPQTGAMGHPAGANLRGVSDPQFVTELREQALESLQRARRFDTYTNRLQW
jgi:hypothetical protein